MRNCPKLHSDPHRAVFFGAKFVGCACSRLSRVAVSGLEAIETFLAYSYVEGSHTMDLSLW
jgi:hypothetical protein